MTAMGIDLDALEGHRRELTGYCYRMLGSAADAEDAAQETMLRAWRARDRYDAARGPLRPWVLKIATNVCTDVLRGARRRALAVDLGPASRMGDALGAPLPDREWVLPIPDRTVVPEHGDPAEIALARHTIRLAFVAALQRLPARQRAVLILREVLCFTAPEAAGVLDTSVAAVNSALQRARATLAFAPGDAPQPAGPEEAALAARYCEAFERDDVEALVSLLREDATMSMPPFRWWLGGRDEIERVLRAAGSPCAGSRLLATTGCGGPAFGQYRPAADGVMRPFGLVLLDVRGGMIAGTTTFLMPALFPAFALPPRIGDEVGPAGS